MKKILFGITSLTIGGAERVLVDIANRLSEVFDITIFTIYPNGEFEKSLNDKIKVKSLYNVQYNKLTKIKKIVIPINVWLNKKRIYEKYISDDFDAEIAFLEGPITRLFSVKNLKTKKIAWIHNDIGQVFGQGIKAKIKKYVDNKIYMNFNKLIFVSNDNKTSFERVYPKNSIDKEVIYNYIDKDNVLAKVKCKIEEKFEHENLNFVIVSRLVEQKAIDRLAKVHAKLIEEGFNHNFYIIGDGPERHKIERIINETNIENTFKMIGQRENPYPYIKEADYFCLFSYYEGYGMVLEEAKILNKKILITDTATREAVNGYNDYEIFENTEVGIYKGLKKIIQKNKKIDSRKIEDNNTQKVNDIVYNNEYILDKIIEIVGE